MAPKHKQLAKTGGMSSTSTSSDKEGLVKKRALKRAERVEARRVEAEKRKEAVRYSLCATDCDCRAPAATRDEQSSRDSRF
jgi:glutamate dehydrogenase/leucine dehydrogenase